MSGEIGCRHFAQQGRPGQQGSWCTACGVQVFAVHDRPCGECKHFRLELGARVIGICRPKLMAVTSDMHVTYGVLPDTATPLCFEPHP